jgi:hypothetical protein
MMTLTCKQLLKPLLPWFSDAIRKAARVHLTQLYNERPTWLDLAHKRLDDAVFDAYGWPRNLTDDEILARLLALNLERAGKQGAGPAQSTDDA